jgi:hypothetical protein
MAALLSRKTGPDNGDNVRLGQNSLKKDSTDAVDDYDGGSVRPGDCLDESVAVVPWVEVVTVACVAFDGDVAIFVRLILPRRK